MCSIARSQEKSVIIYSTTHSATMKILLLLTLRILASGPLAHCGCLLITCPRVWREAWFPLGLLRSIHFSYSDRP